MKYLIPTVICFNPALKAQLRLAFMGGRSAHSQSFDMNDFYTNDDTIIST